MSSYVIQRKIDGKYYNGKVNLPLLLNEGNYTSNIKNALKFKLKRDAKLVCGKDNSINIIKIGD